METAGSGKIKARQKEKAAEAKRMVSQKVPFYMRGMINNLLKSTLKGSELREMAKSILVKLQISDLRLIFNEIGHRLEGKGILADWADVYHCAWSEIHSILRGYWDGDGLGVLVDERKTKTKEMEAFA